MFLTWCPLSSLLRLSDWGFCVVIVRGQVLTSIADIECLHWDEISQHSSFDVLSKSFFDIYNLQIFVFVYFACSVLGGTENEHLFKRWLPAFLYASGQTLRCSCFVYPKSGAYRHHGWMASATEYFTYVTLIQSHFFLQFPTLLPCPLLWFCPLYCSAYDDTLVIKYHSHLFGSCNWLAIEIVSRLLSVLYIVFHCLLPLRIILQGYAIALEVFSPSLTFWVFSTLPLCAYNKRSIMFSRSTYFVGFCALTPHR